MKKCIVAITLLFGTLQVSVILGDDTAEDVGNRLELSGNRVETQQDVQRYRVENWFEAQPDLAVESGGEGLANGQDEQGGRSNNRLQYESNLGVSSQNQQEHRWQYRAENARQLDNGSVGGGKGENLLPRSQSKKGR